MATSTTDDQIVLDYRPAGPPYTERLGKALRLPAACGLLVSTAILAFWMCLITVAWSRAHDNSFGGCAVGRMHAFDLVLAAVIPAMATLAAAICRRIGFDDVYQFTRIATAATWAAYLVLWLDLLRILEFVKFEVFR